MNAKKILKSKGVFNELNTEGRVVTDYKKLAQFINHCKGLGLRIVLTQGTFDMVHVGHGRYLQRAKEYGDILIVGIDSDKKVRMRKGPERPVVPQEERLEMLTHLRHVDLVVLKDLGMPKWHLIRTVKPDVLIATSETYNKKQLKDLKEFCVEVVVLEPMATTSTSAKIRLMQIGTAQKLGKTLTPKLIQTIEDVLSELK